MTRPFANLTDDQLLALCIFAEARGEPEAGRIAVGSVVLNRVAYGLIHKTWAMYYGYSIQTVILAPLQFSWVNEGPDPNHLGAVEIAKDFQEALTVSFEGDMALWTCCEIAENLISGSIGKNTAAMYYHDISVNPPWAKGKTPTLTIGKLIFYL